MASDPVQIVHSIPSANSTRSALSNNYPGSSKSGPLHRALHASVGSEPNRARHRALGCHHPTPVHVSKGAQMRSFQDRTRFLLQRGGRSGDGCDRRNLFFMVQSFKRSKRSFFGPIRRCRLIDHLVGDREERRRHIEAGALAWFKADHQLEPGGLHNRQVHGFAPLRRRAA